MAVSRQTAIVLGFVALAIGSAYLVGAFGGSITLQVAVLVLVGVVVPSAVVDYIER